MDREPIYRDFWRPQGVGWAVGTFFPIPTGENVVLMITRRTERGPVERAVVQKLDELRPHLARSALLSARLQSNGRASPAKHWPLSAFRRWF